MINIDIPSGTIIKLDPATPQVAGLREGPEGGVLNLMWNESYPPLKGEGRGLPRVGAD